MDWQDKLLVRSLLIGRTIINIGAFTFFAWLIWEGLQKWLI